MESLGSAVESAYSNGEIAGAVLVATGQNGICENSDHIGPQFKLMKL